ncbi:MAG TPA: Ig-like domain-containing protein [Dehalococcoidales bacterium]
MVIVNQARGRLTLAISLLFLMALSACAPHNNAPVITDVTAEPGWVLPQGSAEVKCVASDPDGDELTYVWSASGGTISESGPVVRWTAPEAKGTYTITVKVADTNGGEATKQIVLNVSLNHPPRIESLSAAPPVIRQAEGSMIDCVASDPDGDGLSYQWSAERGQIVGQGPVVEWLAPTACADYIVIVTVTDSKGAKVSQSVTITVKKAG